MNKMMDKFRGCLVGGAAGDALGYAVEFLSEDMIADRFGEGGITAYQLHQGLARISDDTQMTLFTANGLLSGVAKACAPAKLSAFVAQAYMQWYKTQITSYERRSREQYSCWLMDVPGLYAARAPGNTCMTAITQGCCGSPEQPINNSKGCGGVMRVAPIGLLFGQKADRLGAEVAALTHGHEMGYIPAALLVHIVGLVAHNDAITLKAAVLDGLAAMKELFAEAAHLPAFIRLIEQAMELAAGNTNDLDAIHALGAGWVGDEALAIAIYCALKYEQDFDKAMIAAVNHGGDSDSTGAIAGNILGAYLGLSAIGEKYIQNLELLDVIVEIADDLYCGCGNSGDSCPENAGWQKKYGHIIGA